MYDFLGLLALNDSGAGLGSVVQRRWCSITHKSTRIQSSMPAFVYLASRLKLWMWLSRCSWSAPPQQHLDLFGSLQGLNRELSPVFPTHDLDVHRTADRHSSLGLEAQLVRPVQGADAITPRRSLYLSSGSEPAISHPIDACDDAIDLVMKFDQPKQRRSDEAAALCHLHSPASEPTSLPAARPRDHRWSNSYPTNWD
ncbi:hypothetical protein PCANC_25624 [Puccinia coronata f. sp. avenae]|uniref:Uncharacterized protein n=1 Tax=Puccinia coronata f. sp. avenae TaxID=200324 RepID=A0A2N5TJ71_9BASI|nr:hypothetical protein PCANC_25624 [Puccinia coronata f. sp. avenae]